MKYLLTLLCFSIISTVDAQIYFNSSNVSSENTETENVETSSLEYSGETSNESNQSIRSTTSASIVEDVPPNAEPGKCYARCLIADKYDWVNKKVIDKPKVIKKVKVPALYKTVYDTVVLKPRSVRKVKVPAEYETLEEKIMVSPATTKWVKGKADAGCLSADPEDCQVMCLVEVPAQYRTVKKKVLKHDAYTSEIISPEEIEIKTRKVQVQAERFMEIEIPATYKTVQERVVVKKGGYQEWREVLCGDEITSERIVQIQRALKSAGYNPGPIDDVFGPLTKEALIQYQRDNGLPVGNLNIETLEHLGVK